MTFGGSVACALAAWLTTVTAKIPDKIPDTTPIAPPTRSHPLLAPRDQLCLLGAQVVDPDRRAILRQDIIIEGGRIVAVTPHATCVGQRRDLRGAFLMPGLIDLHVHGWGNPSPIDEAGDDFPGHDVVLARDLRAGVMATLDLAGDDRQRLATRDRLRGSPDHAALFVASALFAGAAPAGAAAPTDAQLRAQVRTRIARQPDVIKIIAGGGPLGPWIDEARRRGLPTVVHISSWQQAAAAVAAGASAITHLEDEVVIPSALVAAWAAGKTWSMPTMAVQCDVHRLVAEPALLDDGLLVQITPPALRAAYRDPERWSKKARYWLRWQKAGCEANDFVSLQRLHAAGVGLLAGSDTGNLGTFQGFSIHRELELMVQAGVPVWEALRAATTNAAAFLRVPWGVRVGVPANVIVLRASPVHDIRNTRAIADVIYRGRSLPPGDATGGAKPRSAAPMSGAAK